MVVNATSIPDPLNPTTTQSARFVAHQRGWSELLN
jgi:hypothetical protein